VIERYGKPSGPLLSLKKEFIDNNDLFLKKSTEINSVYSTQIKRKQCKNCGKKLSDTVGFVKQRIQYVICGYCGHLNGKNQDTKEFCSALYADDGGESYGKNYASQDKKDYEQRANEIYRPKAEFLLDSLKESGEKVDQITVSDLGAGSGYFVSALIQSGMINAKGFEVSEAQVELGNSMMNNNRLSSHDLDQTLNIASTIESDVVTMIGVLEHLKNPREILRALQKNSNVRYLYISVPLFSPTVFFEMVFPDVMQRQLTAGHTHLYTESSLKWMANEFGMIKKSAWWFGSDIFDLYRDILVELNKKTENTGMVSVWNNMFIPMIDAMQLVIDKKHLSSEVHMLLKFED